MFHNKNILITGGSGMIGRQLVSLLLEEKANVHVADLNEPINMSNKITFQKILVIVKMFAKIWIMFLI